MARTQAQMFYQASREAGERDCLVMEMINHPTNPLTAVDLHKLADKHPARWERYRNLLGGITG